MLLLPNWRDTKTLGQQSKAAFNICCVKTPWNPLPLGSCGFHMAVGASSRLGCSHISWSCFYAGMGTYAQNPLEVKLVLQHFGSLSIACKFLWIKWRGLGCTNRYTVAWRRDVAVLCWLHWLDYTRNVVYRPQQHTLHSVRPVILIS